MLLCACISKLLHKMEHAILVYFCFIMETLYIKWLLRSTAWKTAWSLSNTPPFIWEGRQIHILLVRTVTSVKMVFVATFQCMADHKWVTKRLSCPLLHKLSLWKQISVSAVCTEQVTHCLGFLLIWILSLSSFLMQCCHCIKLSWDQCEPRWIIVCKLTKRRLYVGLFTPLHSN